MKLPDFKHYEPLNRLKEQMGIPRNEYGTISVVVTAGGLTVEELKTLVTEGIDVCWDDLTLNPDGTPSYKGNRVLLYIRDVSQYGNQTPQPRYHLATCSKINQMNEGGRGQRYVSSIRTDGVFTVNIDSHAGRRAEEVHLKVCKLCLWKLNFGGYRHMSEPKRQAFVDNFLPEHFFAQYPVSPHSWHPAHDSDSAPPNNYTPDFDQISEQARQAAGWRCSACRSNLSARERRRFLHVHHRNGNRSDNGPQNLQVLCILCHAKEPSHGHLRGTPDYREYLRLRPGL